MGSIDRSCRFHPIFCANQCQIPICFFTERIFLIEEGALKPPILKPWNSVVQPVDQKACVLADIAISKGNGGLDVFNGYRLCFLCSSGNPQGAVISTVMIFRKKEKHLLASLPKREAAPCAFAEARPPTQADWPAGKSFQFLSQFTTSHRYVLSNFCRDTSIFLIPCCGGNVPCLCTTQSPTQPGNWAAPEGAFLGSS